MKKIFILLLMVFNVTACTSVNHPKMLSFTPASVVIDYTNNDLHSATSLGQQYCSSIHKDAQYVRSEEKKWPSRSNLAFFNCVESSRHFNQHLNNFSDTRSPPVINNYK